ncbi:TRAP transporter small permease [Virgibacillus sp. CBA3643]|uniref:TRAP transporter small permease n=1 Tax=Virgibacillus sp. CBA3643 TaxID=2942278 RepID=UPI0035A3AADE
MINVSWFNNILKGLNKIEKYFNISLVLVLVFATFLQVIFRFVLNSPLTWTEELARLCFVWLCVFGSSMALRQGKHIKFDYLTNKLLRYKLNRIRAIIVNILIISFLIYIFVPSLRYVESMNTIPLAGTSWPTGVFFICFPLASIIIVLNLVKEVITDMYLLFQDRKGSKV